MKFNNLLDGLFFYTNCNLCDGLMVINNEGMLSSIANNKNGFTLLFDLENKDKLIIDPTSELIDIDYYNDSIIDCNAIPISNTHYNYNDCFSLQIQCKKCNNFEYFIDILIDFYHRKLLDIRLNYVNYYNGSNNYIVCDYYNQTTILLDSNYQKLIEVPLMKVNKHNIKHLSQRLKKLVIFS